MTANVNKVYAYMFDQQQLVTNKSLDLPTVDAHPDDLVVHQSPTHRIVVRELTDSTALPQGFALMPIRQLLSHWSVSQFEQMSRALQLLEWKKSHQFCSRCGQSTQAHPTEHAMICTACQYHQYPRVQPCVIMAITRGSQILLARAANNQNGMFSVLAGFVEIGETLEQAVARETLEETALHIQNIRYMASQPWPFPSNLMIGFQADYLSGNIYPQAGEIAEAAFFEIDNLPLIPPKGSIAHWMIQQVVAQLSA